MEIKPVYLLYGDERYLIQRDLALFRREFLGDDGLSTCDRFDAKNAELSTILNAAAEVPLFGERRLIIVENAPWFTAGDSEAGALPDYLDAPNPDTCLVFVAEKVDKRKKLTKAVEKVGKIRCHERLKGSDLPTYVRRYLTPSGKRMNSATVQQFLKLTGDDLGIICTDLDKLILFVGERPEITEDDVVRSVAVAAQASMFELADAVSARDLPRTRAVCERLLRELAEREYYSVQGFISNHLRLLLQVKELAERKLGERAIAGELGVHEFRVRKALSAVRHFEAAELEEALCAMTEADYQVKSGHAAFADVFPLALYRLCRPTLPKA